MGMFGKKRDSAAATVYENVKKEELAKIETEKSVAKLEDLKSQAIRDARKESMSTWERLKTGSSSAKNSKTTKKIGKAAKGLLGGLKKAGKNFKKNTGGANPMIGGALGASIQESKGMAKLEPKMPKSKKKKVVTTYYE